MTETRSSDEIRADLALGMADEDFDAATDRLVGDVSPLLSEVERLRDLVAEFRKRDASQDRIRESLTAEVRSLRGVVQAAELHCESVTDERDALMAGLHEIRTVCVQVADAGSSYAPFARRVLSLTLTAIRRADEILSARVWSRCPGPAKKQQP
jgi:hypothetical protein